MKKTTTKRGEKLSLSRETLSALNAGDLEMAAGGSCLSCATGTCEGDYFAA